MPRVTECSAWRLSLARSTGHVSRETHFRGSVSMRLWRRAAVSPTSIDIHHLSIPHSTLAFYHRPFPPFRPHYFRGARKCLVSIMAFAKPVGTHDLPIRHHANLSTSPLPFNILVALLRLFPRLLTVEDFMPHFQGPNLFDLL